MMALLLRLLADAWAMVCVARFLLQLAGLHYSHPLAQFCVHMTQWLVRPLRRAVPPLGRADTATLAAAMLGVYAAYTAIGLLAWADGASFGIRLWSLNALLTMLAVARALAYVLLMALLLQMLLSWFAATSPLLPVLQRLLTPLCRPFAYLRHGRYDFSGSLWMVLLWVWVAWLSPLAEQQLQTWFLR